MSAAHIWVVAALGAAAVGLVYFAGLAARRVPVGFDDAANSAIIIGGLAILLALIRL